MQSLIGDRLLKLFLQSSYRRFHRAGSEPAESKLEGEGTSSDLPGGPSDGQAPESEAAQEARPEAVENPALPQAGLGLRFPRAETELFAETGSEMESVVDDAAANEHGREGCKS